MPVMLSLGGFRFTRRRHTDTILKRPDLRSRTPLEI
jgi:hypothetical protein